MANPIEQTQKHIDNFLKYVQTEIDLLYGVDNDNSKTDFDGTIINQYFSGTCIRRTTTSQINGSSYNGISFTGYFLYDLDVSKKGGESVSNIRCLGGDSFFASYDNNPALISTYNNFVNDCNNVLYSVLIKDDLLDGTWYFPYDGGNTLRTLHIDKNDFDYSSVANNNFATSNYSVETHECRVQSWDVSYSTAISNLGLEYVNVNLNGLWSELLDCNEYYMGSHTFVMSEPMAIVTTDQTFINNYNNHYYGDTINYNTYNTSNDNSVNVYNTNNGFLIAPVVGAGGIAEFNLNFDDLIGALQLAVDDINIANGLSGDNALYVPTYDEIKYADMGSFYITPIKQIDKLPLAPDVADTVIDVSDYVDLLGGASTALFNALDSFGLSLIATFTFLSVLVIRHLKR